MLFDCHLRKKYKGRRWCALPRSDSSDVASSALSEIFRFLLRCTRRTPAAVFWIASSRTLWSSAPKEHRDPATANNLLCSFKMSRHLPGFYFSFPPRSPMHNAAVFCLFHSRKRGSIAYCREDTVPFPAWLLGMSHDYSGTGQTFQRSSPIVFVGTFCRQPGNITTRRATEVVVAMSTTRPLCNRSGETSAMRISCVFHGVQTDKHCGALLKKRSLSVCLFLATEKERASFMLATSLCSYEAHIVPALSLICQVILLKQNHCKYHLWQIVQFKSLC